MDCLYTMLFLHMLLGNTFQDTIVKMFILMIKFTTAITMSIKTICAVVYTIICVQYLQKGFIPGHIPHFLVLDPEFKMVDIYFSPHPSTHNTP